MIGLLTTAPSPGVAVATVAVRRGFQLSTAREHDT
jgi:hypothetical protein